MSQLLESLLQASGHEPIVDEPATTPQPSPPDVNLSPLMHVTMADLCLEIKARIEHSTGMDMVEDRVLEDIVDGLLLELWARKHPLAQAYDADYIEVM